MKCFKTILASLVFSVLISINVYAASNKDGGELCFGNISYSENGAYVTIEANIENNSNEEKSVMLIVASYDTAGRAYNMQVKKQSVGVGMSLPLQIADYLPETGCAVKAYVMESLFGNSRMPMPANIGNSSPDIAYILVNGEPISDFSNDKYRYIVPKTADFEIEAVAKDNVTSVTLNKDASLNVYTVTATAAGNTKTFTVAAYDSAKDTMALNGLSYRTDQGIEGVIENFDNTVIELPKYTKTVTVFPTSDYGGEVVCYVVNDCLESPNDVDYGKMGADAQRVFTAKRKAKDNIIPIKNESSKAVIEVNGTKENGKPDKIDYTITFTAQQPRLTSFVCENKTYYPVFVGGTAIFDDGYYDEDNDVAVGSIVESDRGQVCVAVSDTLIGGSSFLFPVNNNYEGAWWHENTSGEYFSFTADTAGTIYIFAQNGFKNGEYTSDSNGDGWSKVSGLSLTLKKPETTWTNAYSRTFEKDEVVRVYHTGRNTSSNDPKVTGIIIWREPIITSISNINMNVDIAKDITAQLPATVKATILSGDEIDAGVIWDTSNYVSALGEQTIIGRITDEFELNAGVENKVTATVNVINNKIKSVNSIKPIEIYMGGTVSLPTEVNAKTIFNETVSCDVVWDTDGFSSESAGIKGITGTVTPPDGIDADGKTAKVNVIVRYSDPNIVLALDNSGMDTENNKWIDLSSYKNNVTVPIDDTNIKWVTNGLFAKGGVESTVEILNDRIKEAMLSNSFVIEFELADTEINTGGETPFVTADIKYGNNSSSGSFIVSYLDNNKRKYVKIGLGSSYWTVSDSSIISGTHTHKVEVYSSKRSWTVDGAKDEKNTSAAIKDVTSLKLMGNTKITNSNTIGGSTVWKSIKIYKVTE